MTWARVMLAGCALLLIQAGVTSAAAESAEAGIPRELAHGRSARVGGLKYRLNESAQENLDPDPRLKVLEAVDGLDRAVMIRSRFPQ